MDPLGDQLATHPILMCWEIFIELYPNWQFGCIDRSDLQFGNGSLPARTRTWSDGPQLLLTLGRVMLKILSLLSTATAAIPNAWPESWVQSAGYWICLTNILALCVGFKYISLDYYQLWDTATRRANCWNDQSSESCWMYK